MINQLSDINVTALLLGGLSVCATVIGILWKRSETRIAVTETVMQDRLAEQTERIDKLESLSAECYEDRIALWQKIAELGGGLHR